MGEIYPAINQHAKAQDFGGDDEVQFAVEGATGQIRLTRPKALNALTHKMVLAMERALLHWADDPQIKAVIISGEGRAFCAGGDVVAAYHAGKNGSPALHFFKNEYRLNQLIGAYKKPYIALLDGITMGGGAGISVHGSHRIVTENTLFAMPESGIGFFTDVGASAFLPALGEKFGYYLGLTGLPIRWGDCLGAGIATHAVTAQVLPQLISRLSDGEAPDAVLAELAASEIKRETTAAELALIAQCCTASKVEQIIAQFDEAGRQGQVKAQEIAQVLRRRSPTSLQAIFALFNNAEAFMRAHPSLSYAARLERQLQIEYALAEILLHGHDFYAGVGAVLIDKTGDPQWQPATLAEVAIPDFFTI